MDVWRQAVLDEELGELGVLLLFQHQERVVTEGCQGHPFQRRQRMLRRQDGQQVVPFQENGLQLRRCGQP